MPQSIIRLLIPIVGRYFRNFSVCENIDSNPSLLHSNRRRDIKSLQPYTTGIHSFPVLVTAEFNCMANQAISRPQSLLSLLAGGAFARGKGGLLALVPSQAALGTRINGIRQDALLSVPYSDISFDSFFSGNFPSVGSYYITKI